MQLPHHPTREEFRTRNTWIRVVGTVGFLVASSAAFAAIVPINVGGVGMTYGAAFSDAENQARVICSGLGGTLFRFEETSSGPFAGRWVLNGAGLCQTP